MASLSVKDSRDSLPALAFDAEHRLAFDEVGDDVAAELAHLVELHFGLPTQRE